MTTEKTTNVIRNVAFALLIVVLFAMGATTVVEKIKGSQFVSQNIYDSPYFIMLWCLLGVSATIYIFRQRLFRRPVVFALHLSLLLILAGAGLTFFTATRGVMDVSKSDYQDKYFRDDDRTEAQMPFGIRLSEFKTEYYPGTQTPMNFHAEIESQGELLSMSMNETAKINGWQFCLKGYDPSADKVTLSVSHDTIGTGVTYSGYWLLFISMVILLFSPKGRFIQLCRRLSVVAIIGFMSSGLSASAGIVPADASRVLDDVLIESNDRIMPLETFADNVLMKIYGSKTIDGMQSTEVIVDMYLNSGEWGEKEIIKIKSDEVKQIIGIDKKFASYNDFITTENVYKLHDLMSRISIGEYVGDVRAIEEANEKFQILRMIMDGRAFKIFPVADSNASIDWFSPSDKLPIDLDSDKFAFIRYSFNLLTEMLLTGNDARFSEIVEKIKKYQRKEAGENLPSEKQIKAELFYNDLHIPLAMICLIIGVVGWLFQLLARVREKKLWCGFEKLMRIALLLLALWLSMVFCLKWYIGNHIPLGNGPETMQFTALAVAVICLIFGKKMKISATVAFLLSGLVLLVAMMGSSNPPITQLMPVLNSPLLSVHVALIMISYALIGFITLNSLTALIMSATKRGNREDISADLQLSNEVMLYPAVFLLAAGIFVGAMWANVSWGRYWGWDPKEVWALITLLIYSMMLHPKSLPMLHRRRVFHLYLVLASLSVAVTYFGVNYLLGGMHSYA